MAAWSPSSCLSVHDLQFKPDESWPCFWLTHFLKGIRPQMGPREHVAKSGRATSSGSTFTYTPQIGAPSRAPAFVKWRAGATSGADVEGITFYAVSFCEACFLTISILTPPPMKRSMWKCSTTHGRRSDSGCPSKLKQVFVPFLECDVQ